MHISITDTRRIFSRIEKYSQRYTEDASVFETVYVMAKWRLELKTFSGWKERIKRILYVYIGSVIGRNSVMFYVLHSST